MRRKLQTIGNSRGVILPLNVAFSLCGDETELELTVIGGTAVLTSHLPDELELEAALAYALVKARRRRLLDSLASEEPKRPGRPSRGASRKLRRQSEAE